LAASSRGGSYVIKLMAQDILSRPTLYALPASIPFLRLGEMVYHPAATPRMMSRASISILNRTLTNVEQEVSARRVRATELLSEIGALANVLPVRPIHGGVAGFLRLAMLDLGGALEQRQDLGALRGYPLTLDQHPQLQTALLSGERSGKGSRHLRDRLFTLPTHARSPGAHASAIAGWLRQPDHALSGVPAYS